MNKNDIGYNSFFESERNRLGLGEFSVARVTSESRGAYKVKNENGEYLAKITGKQMFEAKEREDYPAVGDWVAMKDLGDERAEIVSILPRATMLKRKHGDKSRLKGKDKTQVIASNIDVAFIVESVGRDYNLNRFERYLAIAKNGKVEPIIVLNKVDLISKEELKEKLTQIQNRIPGVEVLSVSAVKEGGENEIKKHIQKGKTYCFLGSSGVGKSSLINRLLGKSVIRTEDISLYSDRGKHVTTVRQMYFLEDGGIVIDNPGVREVGLATDAREGVEDFFQEITTLAEECKYTDCAHVNEPGCAVLKAVRSGKLDEEKYSNFIGLKKETEYNEMSGLEKKEKDRQFGKFINKAKKDFKKIGHKDY